MALNHNEKEALKAKLKNPTEKVLCPRCGKELKYICTPSAEQVYCETDPEITASLRGI